jgi:hypothetical protein
VCERERKKERERETKKGEGVFSEEKGRTENRLQLTLLMRPIFFYRDYVLCSGSASICSFIHNACQTCLDDSWPLPGYSADRDPDNDPAGIRNRKYISLDLRISPECGAWYSRIKVARQ